MYLRPNLHGLLLLLLSPTLHAQTDHPASTAPVTRAIAVYEWTGELGHPTAARLLPVSLFIHDHLEDAGVYLAQPIPLALRPGTLYLLGSVGAIKLESAHPTEAPAWEAFGTFLTPAEAAAATAPKPTPSSVLAEPEDDTPAPASAKKKKQKQEAYVTSPAAPILDDPDRPTLQSGSLAAPAVPPELTGLPADLHQVVAVSDAANGLQRNFIYGWPSSSARDQVLHTLEAMALPSLTHYAAFNHLNLALDRTTTPTSHPTFAHAAAPRPTNPQLVAYTLADGTTPTYVLTAEMATTTVPIYLTLIARPAPDSQLHLTLVSLTDAAHLDRTPQLRLIDAVDPDASGTASVLFELRSQSTRQFALYDLTSNRPRPILLTTPTP